MSFLILKIKGDYFRKLWSSHTHQEKSGHSHLLNVENGIYARKEVKKRQIVKVPIKKFTLRFLC
jgi:hypothetical protein